MDGETITTLVLEKNGRLLITLHHNNSEVIEQLRTHVRPGDREVGRDDVEEFMQMLFSPAYAYSISIDEHELPEGTSSRLTVLVVESQDGLAITVHPSDREARQALAESLGLDADRDLIANAEQLGYSVRLVTAALPA